MDLLLFVLGFATTCLNADHFPAQPINCMDASIDSAQPLKSVDASIYFAQPLKSMDASIDFAIDPEVVGNPRKWLQ